jgi:hypothetical protein
MQNKIIRFLMVGLFGIGITLSVSAEEYKASIGYNFTGFASGEDALRTSLLQSNIPISLTVLIKDISVYFSSGYSSVSPYMIKGTEFFGSRQSISDTRIGVTIPLWKEKILVSGNWLLPQGLQGLSLTEEETETALSTDFYKFPQTRMRDGNRINASIAGMHDIGKFQLSGGIGGFAATPFTLASKQSILPGAILVINAGSSYQILKNLISRLDVIYSYNTATLLNEEKIFKQGSSLTISSLEKYDFDSLSSLVGKLYCNLNFSNQFFQTENVSVEALNVLNRNANRPSVGIEAMYQAKPIAEIRFLPTLGFDYYFTNDIDPTNLDLYKQAQSRFHLGIGAQRLITPFLMGRIALDGYLGNNNLRGIAASVFIDFGAKRK